MQLSTANSSFRTERALADGEMNKMLSDDEENLFDRPKSRLAYVEEHTSVL
jgi:hypothetical protein